MSLILMINGVLNIVMSCLFFFYTNKYRHLCKQYHLIMYSSFSLYFLFIGFLKIRIALEMDKWFEGFDYTYSTVFDFTSIITYGIIIVFLYLGIKFKGKIIKKDGNTRSTKKDVEVD